MVKPLGFEPFSGQNCFSSGERLTSRTAVFCPPWEVGAPALVVDRPEGSEREVLAMRGGPEAVLPRCFMRMPSVQDLVLRLV